MSNLLEVKNLVCCYGDIVAVDDVSFTIGDGEIFGLIGANGAGKTSTILALAGLLPISSGSVILNGTDLASVPTHKRIDYGLALVPEGRRVFAALSVNENLTVGGTRLDAHALEQGRSRVFDIFPRLAERRDQVAGSLSGGEQQMLALGRAVIAQPKVLLVDELSLGLMPIAIDHCYTALQHLQKEGIAILLVEQSTERVLQAADRIAVLDSGRIAWSGNSQQTGTDASILNAYLGLTDSELTTS